WDAELNGERGYIPAKYVEIILTNEFQIPEYDQEAASDEDELEEEDHVHIPTHRNNKTASSLPPSLQSDDAAAAAAMQSSLLANEHFPSSGSPSHSSYMN